MTPAQIHLTLTLDESAAKVIADLLVLALRQALAPPPPTESETKRQARLFASRKAIFGGEEPPTEHGFLIDGKAASRLLGVSEKTLQRMSRNGEMPPLIKIGRVVRLSYPALKAWVETGCPPVNKG
jgi:excisionase family DNA binding protein